MRVIVIALLVVGCGGGDAYCGGRGAVVMDTTTI